MFFSGLQDVIFIYVFVSERPWNFTIAQPCARGFRLFCEKRFCFSHTVTFTNRFILFRPGDPFQVQILLSFQNTNVLGYIYIGIAELGSRYGPVYRFLEGKYFVWVKLILLTNKMIIKEPEEKKITIVYVSYYVG